MGQLRELLDGRVSVIQKALGGKAFTKKIEKLEKDLNIGDLEPYILKYIFKKLGYEEEEEEETVFEEPVSPISIEPQSPQPIFNFTEPEPVEEVEFSDEEQTPSIRSSDEWSDFVDDLMEPTKVESVYSFQGAQPTQEGLEVKKVLDSSDDEDVYRPKTINRKRTLDNRDETPLELLVKRSRYNECSKNFLSL